MKLKIMHVEWVDASGAAGWINKYTPVDLRCFTVGFLVTKEKDKIILAMNKSFVTDKSFGDYIEIPRVSITKMTVIKTVEEAKDE